MSFVIIVDMRKNCGEILAIRDDEQWLSQYDTEEEAEELMKKHPLKVFPYDIIDMGN